MKKIYLSIAAVAISIGASAQVSFNLQDRVHTNKAVLAPNAKIPGKTTAFKTTGGAFNLQIDPIADIMTQKGIDLNGSSTTPSQDIFLSGIFQDSTVIFGGSTSNRSVSDILSGVTLDPKSSFLTSSFAPIVDKVDSYNLDSVYILGSYIKKTAATDTLYTWIVWGDTTNTSVYTKFNSSSVWLAPISDWRKSVIGPKLSGYTAAAGNKVKAAAPSTNQVLVKYVLTPDDSVSVNGRIKYIPIALPSTITIPAGNIVSCFYTFVPGGAYSAGDCIYSFGATPQNINGFAGTVWNQTSPVVNAVADYLDQQVDAQSWNMGISYDKNQRHGKYSATYGNASLGDLVSAPSIIFHIFGNSTVGIQELDKKGFVLGQNVPNPFSSSSEVSYMLSKTVSSAVFTITDVMGRVISTENVEKTEGTHFVKVKALAAGVYYYTLNVDGKITTRKMIAQ